MRLSTNLFAWILRLLAAFILLQTLFFKFAAAPESVYIFTKVGIEPWGRIATGVVELIASVLILYPKTTAYGALLAMGVMGGAILSHLTILGLVVQNDGGQLFIYAAVVFVSSAILIWIYRSQLLALLPARFSSNHSKIQIVK